MADYISRASSAGETAVRLVRVADPAVGGFELRAVYSAAGDSPQGRVALVGRAGNPSVARTIDWGDGSGEQNIPAQTFDNMVSFVHDYGSGFPTGTVFQVRIYQTGDPDGAHTFKLIMPMWRILARVVATNPASPPNEQTPTLRDVSYALRGTINELSPPLTRTATLTYGDTPPPTTTTLEAGATVIRSYNPTADDTPHLARISLAPNCDGFPIPEGSQPCEVWKQTLTTPFTAYPRFTTSLNGSTVTVTGNAVNTGPTYTVDFGDGVYLNNVAMGDGATYPHTYNQPGAYTLRVWPADNPLLWGFQGPVTVS